MVKVKIEHEGLVKFDWFIDNQGNLIRQKESKFLMSEEDINIYHEEILNEYNLEV